MEAGKEAGMRGAVPSPGRSALVLYASETGNAQDVAEDIGRLCERLRFPTHVAELDSISLRQLLRPDLVIFAISTTGQGELPANAQSFWRLLRSVRLPPGCLQSVRFTSFGLGDSSYPKFNWAHRKLYNRMVQLGAQAMFHRGESDEQHPEGIDGSFIPWSTSLRNRLLEHYPIPEGEEPIPEDVLLEPKWALEVVDDEKKELETNGFHSNGALNRIENEAAQVSDIPPTDLLEIPQGITAKVVSNNRLTPQDHWQDVRHVTFDLSETKNYGPGDVLTIYPKNFPTDVAQFLKIMKYESLADTPIRFTPTATLTPNYPPPPIACLQNKTFTLRTLATNHLDIMSIPRRSFFAHLIHCTEDEMQLDRLKEFTDPQYIDELFDYTTRPRRSILEVLDEFTTLTVPWQKICSIIPLIRGRQFSIASGGALKTLIPSNGGKSTTRVELLIAIVKYKTVIKRVRQGVCTRYITSLTPGTRITTTLQRGALLSKNADVNIPIVMVGPGTGVAPLRSLAYERLAQRQSLSLPIKPTESDILIYGARSRSADYFFSDEWDTISSQTGLKVHTAFSRDQRQKVYVQDIIRQQGRDIYHVLAEKRGVFYLSGSSGKMPLAVREALVEVFVNEGKMERDDAEKYLAAMEKDGRYRQETW
ncbi:sulfite reductase flavoprotein alpha-component [Venturia nashicola]|uniref:NADPH-dependent diflavin oxidoreductase 1 n=1 Tax=Venturia nashicola TaxID=86259 RepID=A0A4Z1P1Q8_9PEZI|nr:sulfite reductase flavoprotein alpha-component [Venturia nashicola]